MDSLKVGENLIFRKTLDVCPVSIFILDAQGEFIYANHKAEQIFGLTLSDLADRKYDSPAWHVTDFEGNLVAPEDFAFSRVMATGEPVEAVETAVNIAHEARIYCSVNAYPLKNKSGEVEGVIATAEDLTALIEAKKRLERSDTNYRDLFQNLVDEVHLWKLVRDANGQINTWELIDANPPALKAWGKKHSEVIGKTAREIFSYDAEKQFMPLVQKIFEEGQPFAWEQYFEPTNQWLSMTSVPFNDFFISTGRDVTEKKIAEQKLIEANRLKTEFLQKLEKVAIEERERISKELHDNIVQQLVAVNMALNLISENNANEKSEAKINEIKGRIKSITSEVRELSHKLQESDMQGQSLKELLINLEKDLKMYHEIHFDFEIEFQEEHISDFIKTQVYRIAQELVLNIIKHANADQAKLMIKGSSEQLMLEVQDNGLGRISEVSQNGIGLSNIAKRVESMHGKLEYPLAEKGWQTKITIPLSTQTAEITIN